MNLQKDTWDQLHVNDYHQGGIDGIVSRILNDRNHYGELHDIFGLWEQILSVLIDLRDKTVLEIGHGGGWYLVQALDRGAKQAIGIELSSLMNNFATKAFQQLGIQSYRFYNADERCLDMVEESVDVIHSITVFQHTDEAVTRKYLTSAHRILNPGGAIYAQFRMRPVNAEKNLSGLGMFYTKSELDQIFLDTGFEIAASGKRYYDPVPDSDFWGMFKLVPKKNPS